MSLYPGTLHRGRQVQKILWDPLMSCHCASDQELLPPLPPNRLYREARYKYEQTRLEESLSTARAAEARGQPAVGSSRKELLHEKLGTSCFLPQGLSQCLC